MGRQKDQHHEEILRNSRIPRTEVTGINYAEEEHYAEQRRHAANKAKREIPIADPVFPTYAGRRDYPADPATDAERFESVCRDADKEAQKTGFAIVVFKNREGQYLTWEEKYISSANPIEALYTAPAPAKKSDEQ